MLKDLPPVGCASPLTLALVYDTPLMVAVMVPPVPSGPLFLQENNTDNNMQMAARLNILFMVAI